MRLINVRLQLFRNIVASQTLEIEGDVTGLIGKNESGKTTILKALHRLNPANGTDRAFHLTTEYPRWRLAPDRRTNSRLGDTTPVSATFALDEADRVAVGTALGTALPEGTICIASRTYDNVLYLTLDAPLAERVRAAGAETDIPADDLASFAELETMDEVRVAARERARALRAGENSACGQSHRVLQHGARQACRNRH
jgi:hypothetical protein